MRANTPARTDPFWVLLFITLAFMFCGVLVVFLTATPTSAQPSTSALPSTPPAAAPAPSPAQLPVESTYDRAVASHAFSAGATASVSAGVTSVHARPRQRGAATVDAWAARTAPALSDGPSRDRSPLPPASLLVLTCVRRVTRPRLATGPALASAVVSLPAAVKPHHAFVLLFALTMSACALPDPGGSTFPVQNTTHAAAPALEGHADVLGQTGVRSANRFPQRYPALAKTLRRVRHTVRCLDHDGPVACAERLL